MHQKIRALENKVADRMKSYYIVQAQLYRKTVHFLGGGSKGKLDSTKLAPLWKKHKKNKRGTPYGTLQADVAAI